MHDLIPVFARDYSEQYSDGLPRGGEVGVPVGETGEGKGSRRAR